MNDELMQAYNDLSLQSEIPDMEAYALAWRDLMAKAFQKDRPALAANCRNRWRHYEELASLQAGAYARTVEGSIADLSPVEVIS
jgi:hypothetical protein